MIRIIQGFSEEKIFAREEETTDVSAAVRAILEEVKARGDAAVKEYCARFDDLSVPWRTANALREMGWSEVRVPPNDLFDPRDEIDR